MKAAVQKTGTNNDALLGRFKSLYVGEKYEPSFEEKAASRATSKGQAVTETPFKPSNPQKKSSGLGNYYGCIGGKVTNMKAYDEGKKMKGDFEMGPAIS